MCDYALNGIKRAFGFLMWMWVSSILNLKGLWGCLCLSVSTVIERELLRTSIDNVNYNQGQEYIGRSTADARVSHSSNYFVKQTSV